jgi:hypothetical protein
MISEVDGSPPEKAKIQENVEKYPEKEASKECG